MMIGITYGLVTTSGGREHVEEFICSAWPGRNEQKVRSEISYSAAPSGEFHQWGFDIAPGSLKLVWTKLELDQQERPDELELILKALDRMEERAASVGAEFSLSSWPERGTHVEVAFR